MQPEVKKAIKTKERLITVASNGYVKIKIFRKIT